MSPNWRLPVSSQNEQIMKRIFSFLVLFLAMLHGIAQNHFEVAYTSQPQTYMNIYIFEAKIGSENLQSGDEVAVFDGNVCTGVEVLSEDFDGLLMVIAAKAEEEGTGYTVGNPIVVKVWDSSAEQEYEADVEFLADSEHNVFTDNGSAKVNLSVKFDRSLQLTAPDKDYDGSADAFVDVEVTGGELTGDVTVTATGGSFDNKNAGTGKTVTGNITVSGADAGNYNFTIIETTTASINPKNIATEDARAEDKVYDGGNTALIAGTVLTGIVDGDEVFIGNSEGSFSQSNVGENIPVTAAIELSGADSDNYTLSQPEGLSADITPKTINVYANDRNKQCNQNDPSLTYLHTPDLVPGDAFSGQLSREQGEMVGQYSIVQGTLSLGSNYNLIFNPGTFTISDEAPNWVTGEDDLNRTLSYSDENGIATAQSLAPEAVDLCDSETPTIVKSAGEFVPENGCSRSGTYTNQWIAVDQQGNVSGTFVQVITLIDDVAPVFASIADQEIVAFSGGCETAIDYPDIEVEESCLDTVFLYEGLGPDAFFPVGTTIESWVAVDHSGNADTLTFEVTVTSENVNPPLDSIPDIEVVVGTQNIDMVITGIYGNACTSGDLFVSAKTSSNELVDSINVIHCDNNSKGILEMVLVDGVVGSSLITVTVTDDEGRSTEQDFMLSVVQPNQAPFLVHAMEDVEVSVNSTFSSPLSSVLGEYFDDADGDELSFSVYEKETGQLPSWADYVNDSLVYQPASSDTGCVDVIVKASDPSGAFATDTFNVCVTGIQVNAHASHLNALHSSVYPNPTDGVMHLELNRTGKNLVLLVFDERGSILMRKEQQLTNSMDVDMSTFEPGLYLLRLYVDGERFSHKVVLEQ